MKKITLIWIAIALMIISIGIVYGDSLPLTTAEGAPIPTQWDTVTHVKNYTYYNATPLSLNYTRGYIYDVTLQVMQNTHRWIGYVGNITGNVSLMDNDRNRLYGWDLDISSGEIYATRFNGNVATGSSPVALAGHGQRAGTTQGISDYDYVDWTNVSCASRQYIYNESIRLGHNSTVHNDDLNKTFAQLVGGMDFTVADRYIDVSNDLGATGCGGIYLYQNNAATTGYWQEVILEDGSTDGVLGDVIFAAVIEDDKTGFNGGTYDFQIMLPQYGQVLTGTTDNQVKQNIAYYFYLELVGERWLT